MLNTFRFEFEQTTILNVCLSLYQLCYCLISSHSWTKDNVRSWCTESKVLDVQHWVSTVSNDLIWFVDSLCFTKSKVDADVCQKILEHFILRYVFREIMIHFSAGLNLPTVPKLLPNGQICQIHHPTWTIHGELFKGRCETPDPKIHMS